jgi:hypothetical protein
MNAEYTNIDHVCSILFSRLGVVARMLEYCTYACRSILFLSILFILGYIILSNEKKDSVGKKLGGLLEKFADCGTCDVNKTEIIRTVFRNYLGRDPTEEEIQRYGNLMTNSSDVMSVVNAVKNSDEYKQLVVAADKKDFVLNMSEVESSPLIQDLEKVEVKKRLDTYRDIAKAYNETLDRMPNNRELVYYSHKLLTDKDFSVPKLMSVLQGSQEYKMIEKSQTNVVHSELKGNITDAQLTLDVRNMYKEVFDQLPLQDQEIYLKSKYIEYSLDKKKFLALLLMIKELDAKKDVVAANGDISIKAKMNIAESESLSEDNDPTKSKLMASDSILDPVTGKPVSLSNDNNVIEEQWKACSGSTCTQEETNKQPIYQNPNIINIINPSAEELDKILSTLDKYELGKKAQDGVSGVKKCYSNKDIEDPFYKQNGKGANGDKTCNFSKDNLENWLKARDRQELAEYQLTRELDGLKNNCTRNTYFMNVDDELNSGKRTTGTAKRTLSGFDEMNPSDLGAPLNEARKTHVGSILPAFVYRENAMA